MKWSSFLVGYLVFRINEWFLGSQKIRSWIWEYLKMDLFYIGGACQSSGACCKNLMIFNQDVPLVTQKLFEAFVQKKPEYGRFQPTFRKDKTIQHYNCPCLTKGNRCNDYQNRPRMCHNYPSSSFLNETALHQGCGYKIQKRIPFPNIRDRKLLALIDHFQTIYGV